MAEEKLKKENIIKNYLEMMNFLSEGSADYLFLWDFSTERIYFSENTREKFAIMQKGLNYCTLEELFSQIFPKDLPALAARLDRSKFGEGSLFYDEHRMKTRKGAYIWVGVHGRCIMDSDGTSGWMLGKVSQAALDKKLDMLTGVFNLDALHEDLKDMIEQERDGYFLMIGTNELRQINLSRGRAFGDSLLKTIAETVAQETDGQKVYRMNGDCFAVSLMDVEEQEVTSIFAQIRKKLREKCTLSAGCVPFRKYRIQDAATMLQYAEVALKYSRKRGNSRLRFFTEEDYEKDLERVELKEELKSSVEHGFEGFFLCYQAQVSGGRYELYGAEALLRYHSPRRGIVSPVEFIPILEATGLICQVGAWVLDTALAQCRKWREIMPDFHISVNMSLVQLREKEIAEEVLEALERSGLPGDALTIEVTESCDIFEYSHLNNVFHQWNRFNIEISVDDFGTGYSSLGRLKNIRIDEIKIDRCFVTNIQDSMYNYRLLRNIIDLADSSQIRVCCEGVETEEELAVLKRLSPRLLQGFLFAKPCEPEAFEETYIRQPAGAFRKWADQTENTMPAPEMEIGESDIVSAILESENDVFYVSDLDTHELYYINKAGLTLLGIQDYYGKKCYQALQGLDAPCSFCTNSMLKKDEFYVWERHNVHCGRHFIMKDKIISCKGRNMRLEVALDVTGHEDISQRKKKDHLRGLIKSENQDSMS